jgi:hypothetical protein
MFAIMHALGMFVADLFKSWSRLEAENLPLRHQLIYLDYKYHHGAWKLALGRERDMGYRPRFQGWEAWPNRIERTFVLEKPDLIVVVHDDEIIVRTLGFYATYYKTIDQPQLVLREHTKTDDYELLADAWKAANDRARELGWIV